MEWSSGAVLGRGSFGTVRLAFVRRAEDNRPLVMAVKSAPLATSDSLRHEESVLSDLRCCPHLVRCFGHDVTTDAASGAQFYNLFLEYVAGGTLRDVLGRSGGALREPAVRRYARSILRALDRVHSGGYVHCDLKLQNILVESGGADVKIADLGLAKRIEEEIDAPDCGSMRGTPLYMSPESVARREYGAPGDIWSFGCAVAEMVTGRPAWSGSDDGDAWGLMFRIGFSDELPDIPSKLSEEGKDFLSRCFVKDPLKRWTAEMLLQHPFIAAEEDLVDAAAACNRCSSTESSPRSVFGLPQWLSPRSPSNSIDSSLMESVAPDSRVSSPSDRIRELATMQQPTWSSPSTSSSADGWIDVRISDANLKSEEPKHETQATLEEMPSRIRRRDDLRPENRI
ncbi:unnamed protein product [Musa acuminata subsp. burmannicoides]